MSQYNRGFERDEQHRLNSALILGICGIVLSWVPFLGVILSSIGFVKALSCLARRKKGRQVIIRTVCTLGLAISLAVTAFEVYSYVRNPDILSELAMKLTGTQVQEQQGTVYSMGEGEGPYAQGYTEQGYYNEKGELVPYAKAEDVVVGKDEMGG